MMKKFTITSILLMSVVLLMAQVATPPVAGDGTSGNPYQIATLENLYWLSQNSSEWDKDYIQTAYIDAFETATWDDGDGGDPEGFSPIGNSTTQFKGSYNGQNYAIDGLTINRPGSDNVGLFGYAGAVAGQEILSNIVLWNTNHTGAYKTGGICGYLSGTSMSDCKVTYSRIEGNEQVGGLCGYAVASEINGCFVYESNVLFNKEGGLLCGRTHFGSSITECFGTGTVDGGSSQGGLVGVNSTNCVIEDCYAQANFMQGHGIAYLTYGSVNRCYSASEFETTSGSTAVIATVASGGSATSLYYDADLAVGIPDPNNNGTGKTTTEMQTQTTFTGWDFTNTWEIDGNVNNGGYPHLQNNIPPDPPVISISSVEVIGTTIEVTVNIGDFGSSNPSKYGVCYNTTGNPTMADTKVEHSNPPSTGSYTVTISGLSTLTYYYIRAYAVNDDGPGYSDSQSVTSGPEGSGTEADPYLVPDLATLRWISETSDQWDKHYLQTANIDASETSGWNLGDHDDNTGTPDEYMGFSPIGNSTTNFTGTYNGDGYLIEGLFINRQGYQQIGLFGNANSSTIQNLGLTNLDIVGWAHVGGLVGDHTSGTITSCFSTGSVTGYSTQTGGLIGWSVGSSFLISNCYSKADVVGSSVLGGLIGYYNSGTLSNSYSTGNVSGSAYVGGLIGGRSGGTITTSFWDTETSGTTEGFGENPSSGVTGKTTSEMTTQSTFTDAGWDFVGETTNGTDDIWAMYSYYNDGYPLLDATPQAPAVETNAVSSVTINTATLNGSILNLDSENPTQHGFVWSTISGPSLDDNFSEQGIATETGTYTYDLTGLLPGKTYYVKAYATNALGTSYGEEVSFTTNTNEPATIEYQVRHTAYFAETSTEFGGSEPVVQIRFQIGSAYAVGNYTDYNCERWDGTCTNGCDHDVPDEVLWSGSCLDNQDNIYIGIQGWESDIENSSNEDCIYNAGSDGDYSSTASTEDDDLSSNARAIWTNFENKVNSNNFVESGSSGGNNWYKAYLTVYWNYSLPVDISFSLSDATYDGFTININGFNNYRVNSWDYEIRDDGNNLIAESTGLEYSAIEVTGLDMGTDYYVKVRGTNEAGTGDYSSAQSISTLIPEIDVTASLGSFSTSLGTPSASQSFTVSGSNLLDDISIAALGDFEYSTDDVTFISSLTLTQSNGTLAETTVYVRLAGASAGVYDGDIVISSTSAEDQNVAATGETTSPNALNLDGLDDYVDCGNDASLQITGTAFTLEAWIQADSWADEVWKGTIISKESPGNGYFLRCGDNGLLNVGFGDGSNGHETTTATGQMVVDRWYHVAGVYNGTTLKLFIDGAEVASENYTQSVGNNTENLLIGDSPYYSGRLFDGIIDEVRVWNIARTQTEIHDNMYNELIGNESGLVAYYTFNQGNPGGENTGETTLYDQTSNGNDGTLSGPFTLTGSSSNWVISGAFSPTLVWDGSEGTDWAESGNWSNGNVPVANDHIIIPSTLNNPQINSGIGASCNNLTVESGGMLTIKHGGSFINSGTVTNSGIINMELSVADGKWHLISIPSAGITAETFLGDYLQYYDETVPDWVDISDPDAPLNTNMGYALWATGGKSSYTFTGTPLTGDQSATVTLSDNFPDPGVGNDGANLLGNPYPSAIDWSGLDDTWGAVYYWDPAANSGAGDYVEWNDGVGSGSQYIPPLQGFFIVVDESNTTNGTGTFTLTNNNRTHSGATGFYKSKIENGLVLETRTGKNTDELFIRFKEESNSGFDLQTDALKFFSGAEGIPQIYSFGDNRKLAIDTRPECETVLLGFESDQAGFYSISLKEIEGIGEATLEDTKTNIIHDLTKSAYEFAWNVTDDEARFKLHLNAVGVEENQLIENDILIYAANQQIFVKGAEYGTVTVSDIMGRILHQQEISGNDPTIIPVNYRTGVYIVTVENGKEVKTEKIFIK